MTIPTREEALRALDILKLGRDVGNKQVANLRSYIESHTEEPVAWQLVDPLPTSRGHAFGDWRDIRACLEALVVDYMSLPDHTRDALWKFAEALPKIHPAMTFNCAECGKTFSRVNQYRCADCNATCCENCIRPHFGPDHQPHASPVQPVLEWSAAQLMYNGRVIGFVSSWFWGVANSISGWKMVLCGQEIDKFPYEDGEKWGDLTTYNKARSALETAARQWLSIGDK